MLFFLTQSRLKSGGGGLHCIRCLRFLFSVYETLSLRYRCSLHKREGRKRERGKKKKIQLVGARKRTESITRRTGCVEEIYKGIRLTGTVFVGQERKVGGSLIGLFSYCYHRSIRQHSQIALVIYD